MNTENELPAEDAPEMNEAANDTAEQAAQAEADAQADIAADLADIDAGDLDVAAEVEVELESRDYEAEIAELNDKLLRAMAESENIRRIASREKADASKYAVTNFARDILRVADFLNMATMAVTDEARKADQSLDNLCVGIDMTMKELLNVFEGQGIKPIKTDGPFDHNIHEAVSQEENADVPKGTILRVQRGGFTIQDRLLRPAQVIVSTGGPKLEKDEPAADAGTAPAEGDQQAYEPDGAEPGQTVDQET